MALSELKISGMSWNHGLLLNLSHGLCIVPLNHNPVTGFKFVTIHWDAKVARIGLDA